MPNWAWLPDLKPSPRYRDLDTGQFVSSESVLSWVAESIKRSDAATDTLSQMLASDQLRVQDWERAMRDEIKDEYIRQYILGRGGLEQMTAQDWGSIGGMCADQYRYLDRFAGEIADGKLSESL